MTLRWREPDSNLRSRSCERLFWALPIGDGGTKSGATYIRALWHKPELVTVQQREIISRPTRAARLNAHPSKGTVWSPHSSRLAIPA